MQSILGNTRKPDIIFHRNGKIDITSSAAKSLDLQQGDVVDIMQHDSELLFYVRLRIPVIGRHEGTVMRSNKKGSHFRAYSRKLCRFMLNNCHVEDNLKLCLGQPVRLEPYENAIPIIYKYIL